MVTEPFFVHLIDQILNKPLTQKLSDVIKKLINTDDPEVLYLSRLKCCIHIFITKLVLIFIPR